MQSYPCQTILLAELEKYVKHKQFSKIIEKQKFTCFTSILKAQCFWKAEANFMMATARTNVHELVYRLSAHIRYTELTIVTRTLVFEVSTNGAYRL